MHLKNAQKAATAVCRVLATCGTKAPCARALWGRPDSPLSLVNEGLSTLENLVERLVTLYER